MYTLVILTSLGAVPRRTRSDVHREPAPRSADRAVRVSLNDNRVSAGTLTRKVLTLHLAAREGMWYPDGAHAPGTLAPAFAEDGHAPLIPGPMIRVRAGTEVSVTLRNALPSATLTVHGLTSRNSTAPASRDSMRLSPGASQTIRIHLDTPGTFYYWGTTMGRTLEERTREDAQLTGAIIVDPADGPPPTDRVLVIGMWADTSGHSLMERKRMLVVMNGRSWPQTERLHYTVGDTVHWRLINASADAHPMHLHGFYFHVDSRGDGVGDTLFALDKRDKVVTDLMKPGMTMSMTWSPDRSGNWLFHCHLPIHFVHRGSLGMAAPPMIPGAHPMNHALQGMGGLVMGITVRPAPGHVSSAPVDVAERRQLRLVIGPTSWGSAVAPRFVFTLNDGRSPTTTPVRDRAAPPIVLTRGEPVSITVVNTLSEPTAVHWHGIELESYYDGVAGFSGSEQHRSPVIAPGDSFTARFTPPRAGTFIYHTHIDEERQQPAGLAGPIIVLDAGAPYDPGQDITVVASSAHAMADSTGRIPRIVLLNGSLAPPPLNWQVGSRYRLRFINMCTDVPGLRFELSQDGKPLRWRPLAKDGAELPADRQVMRGARQPVSIGETADVDFTPEHAGDQRLSAHLGDGTLLATMPVHVVAAETRKP